MKKGILFALVIVVLALLIVIFLGWRRVEAPQTHSDPMLHNVDLGMGYQQYDDQIFYKDRHIEGIDSGQAELFGGDVMFLRDDQSVWYQDQKIEGADPETFEIYESALMIFARDRYAVYELEYDQDQQESFWKRTDSSIDPQIDQNIEVLEDIMIDYFNIWPTADAYGDPSLGL